MISDGCPLCYGDSCKAVRARAFFGKDGRIFELPLPSWFFECEDCGYRWQSSTALEECEDAKKDILKNIDYDGEVEFY